MATKTQGRPHAGADTTFGEQRMEGWNGDRLREIRKSVGWSQGRLAINAFVSQANIARWEQGREPSYNNACKLSEALGVNITLFRDDVGLPIFHDGEPGKIDPKPRKRKKPHEE